MPTKPISHAGVKDALGDALAVVPSNLDDVATEMMRYFLRVQNTHYCRKCDARLVAGDNWSLIKLRRKEDICKKCWSDYISDRRKAKRG